MTRMIDPATILYMKKTGDILPDASLPEILFSRANGAITKTIDWTPTITINDAKAGAVIDYQTKITATQSGSGDPSPTNIRPISGFTGANISVNGSTVAVSWLSEAGTVYGGVLDVTTGELTVYYEYRTILSTDLLASDKNYCSARLGELGYVNRDKTSLCNMLTQWTGSASSIPVEHFMVLNSNGYNRAQANIIFDGCKGSTPAETLALNKAYLEALEANEDYLTLCFPLAEPVTYTLTPTEITLSEGANTIYSDTGDSKMTYKAGR